MKMVHVPSQCVAFKYINNSSTDRRLPPAIYSIRCASILKIDFGENPMEPRADSQVTTGIFVPKFQLPDQMSQIKFYTINRCIGIFRLIKLFNDFQQATTTIR